MKKDIDEIKERLGTKIQSIKIDHTDISGDGYNQLCKDEVEILLSMFMQELSSIVEKTREEMIEEVKKQRVVLTTFKALMTTETTDNGKSAETFMAVPLSFTNQVFDILEKKLKQSEGGKE